MPRIMLLGLLCACAAAHPARAQTLPSSPIVLGDGQVVIGGEITATIGQRDETGWFNYTTYDHDALRSLRLSAAAEWRVASRLSLLGELRSDNLEQPYAFAAYARVRPFAAVPLDVQAGRIPPTFGAFGRRLYSNDNPVIGYPLVYQYLMSIRADAIPAHPDDLLRMRTRGWESSFPVGSPVPAPGLPVASGFTWDTGVQVRAGSGPVEGAFAVTAGSLSNPRVDDDNGGRQVVGRVQLQPAFGLIVGLSAAHGAWLDRGIEALVAPGQDRATQRAFGIDVEYSREYWIVRAEGIRSSWRIPGVPSSAAAMDLTATGGFVEGRYRLTPRFFIAGRADRLVFSDIRGSFFNAAATPWEAPISRIEVGGGWYLQRNLVARAVLQQNWRAAGRERRRTFVSGQLLFWF